MHSKQTQRPWPSKVGLSEGVISLKIRCELDYLHGELYFLLQQLWLSMNLCVRNRYNGLRASWYTYSKNLENTMHLTCKYYQYLLR